MVDRVVVKWPCEYVGDGRFGRTCYEYMPDNTPAWCSLCLETMAGAAMAKALAEAS